MRRFLLTQLFSTAGSWMTRVALGWLIFRLSGSVLWLGIVGFAGQLPVSLLAPLGGVVVDRHGARTVLGLVYLSAFLQSMALAGLALAGHLDLAVVLVLAVARGGISAFELPARQAFLCGGNAGRSPSASPLAADSLIVNFGRLLGPALAGAVIPLWGEAVCFLIDGVSYMAPALVLLTSCQRDAAPPGRAARALLAEGWTWIREQSAIRWALLRLGLLSLFGLPFTLLLPAHVSQALAGDSRMLGGLVCASSLGAILAGCLAGYASSRCDRARFWPAVLTAASLVSLGFSHDFFCSFLGVLGASFGLMWQIVATNVALHRGTPQAMRGRVAAYGTMAFWGAAPFGSLLQGVTARWWDVPMVFCLSGLCCLGVILLSAEKGEPILEEASLRQPDSAENHARQA